MTDTNTRLGILLMIVTTLIFAVQDGISRYLAAEYNVYLVVMIRYWIFALFVLAWAGWYQGGIRCVARTDQPLLQVMRGLLLVAEICVMVTGFVYLGLVESLSAFACFPLIIAALSGPILGEHVGWRRWVAIGAGFVGVLIILQPGRGVFSGFALIPLLSATLFAIYSLLTRYAARKDKAETSFFWTGVAGALGMTCVGLFYWESMSWGDYAWMLALSVTGFVGHFLLIKCYEVAEASAVQPFSFLHMVFGSLIGLLVFQEVLKSTTLLGSAIIIAAGVFTILRTGQAKTGA